MALGYMKGDMPKEHLDIAAQLTETCYQMYIRQPTGLSPEVVHMNIGEGSSKDFGHTVSKISYLFTLWKILATFFFFTNIA